MSYILVADDDVDVRNVVEMILQGQFNYEIIKVESGNAAVQHLKEHKDVLAVFTDYRMYDGSGGLLYEFIKKELPKLPVCLVSTYHSKDLDEFKTLLDDNPLNDALVKPFKPDDIIDFVEKVVLSKGIDPVDEVVKVDPDYVKISIEKLLDCSIEGNIFLKLSESKFVMIKKREDSHDPELINKYINKGVTEIYLLNSDYDLYIEARIKTLLSNSGIDENAKIIEDVESIEQVHSCILELGINEKTIALVDKSIDSTLESIKTEEFGEILGKLDKFSSYLFAQSYMTAYISRHIAKYTSWSGYFATYEDIEKAFVVASLFQNISLAENDSLGEISTLNCAEWRSLSGANKELVKSHTINSYNFVHPLISKYKHIGNLIVNHHEKPIGKGFPAGLNGDELDVHESIFIIAVQFAHDILKKEMTKKEMKVLVQSYNEDYDHQEPFKTVYRVFLKSFDQIF